MAVLLKEAGPATDAPEPPPIPASLIPPFDVVTYAGPITVEGYERLSELLEQRRTHDAVLVVLETPGGDPHAAFRIARALGFHYQRVEALIPRYCKSAGTLIVLGASVLHLGDLGELGPLDMQIPRVGEFTSRGSALELGGILDLLLPFQMQSFAAALKAASAHGLTNEAAVDAASHMTARLYRPLLERVDPRRLVEVVRAMSIAGAYGERLAKKGRNIDLHGVDELMWRYPSHAHVIDRKEARRLFRDVRAPAGFVADVERRWRTRLAAQGQATRPHLQIDAYPFADEESSHVLD